MLFVVFCHVYDVVYSGVGSPPWARSLISSAVRFAVPLYFIIAGYFAGRRSFPGGRASSPAGAFRHRIAPIAVNFLAWNVIYIILMKILAGAPLWTLNSLWSLTTGCVHLYFIFVLIQFFIIHTLIRPFLQGRWGAIITICAALMTIGFYVVSDILLWTTGPDGHFFEWHWGKSFAAWSLFYFWGAWLSRAQALIERMSRNLAPLAAATAISLAAYVIETRLELVTFGNTSRDYFLTAGIPFQFLCANLVIAWARRLDASGSQKRLMGLLARSGFDTYGIYLCHYAFLLILWSALKSHLTPFYPSAATLLIGTAVWAASQGLVRVMQRPGLRYFNRLFFR
jgi:surface polysaccharide O-acyltransferase-like enzyme